jgi:hypothetical protein
VCGEWSLLAMMSCAACSSLWNSSRERDGRVQHAQQEQTLVILLQTIFSHLAHDEVLDRGETER